MRNGSRRHIRCPHPCTIINNIFNLLFISSLTISLIHSCSASFVNLLQGEYSKLLTSRRDALNLIFPQSPKVSSSILTSEYILHRISSRARHSMSLSTVLDPAYDQSITDTTITQRSLVGNRRAVITTTPDEQTWHLFEAATSDTLAGQSSLEIADSLWVRNDDQIDYESAISILKIGTIDDETCIHISNGERTIVSSDRDDQQNALETILASAIAKVHPPTKGVKITDSRKIETTIRIISLEDLTSSDPSKLFPIESTSNCEWVDIVDSSGTRVLGSAPRSLVHKFNLLHLGVGIVITDDGAGATGYDWQADQTTNKQTLPSLYVHRRTDSKRIFPSLYDMFVGGVATSDERGDLLGTARRELGEELGLTREDGFTNALFRCVVCTSYNRCVVEVYSYRCNSQTEEVKWQEEEVAWGNFMPYELVEEAAYLSISRLQESKKWPGEKVETKSLNTRNESGEESIWREWDFVPDGLLVWEAWRAWVKKD